MRRAVIWVAVLSCAGCVVDDEIERADAEIVPDAAPPDAMWQCDPGAVAPCEVSATCFGVKTCAGGFWSACGEAPEACDGVDNDCDGAADEDYSALGAACFAGEGACMGQGRIVCGADNTSTVCTAVAGQPSDEVCDGVDDDCDGTVDEGSLAPDACPSPLTGACGRGEVRCVAGEAICAPTVEPTDEVCNGIDDDCDGITDEGDGIPALTAPCYEGPDGTEGIGACAAGHRVCRRGAFQACEAEVQPRDELCDGVDDDCDGLVDEGEDCACVPGAARPCYPGPDGTDGIGTCLAGTQRCLPDGSGYGACLGAVLPAVELCNGRDDDCDGVVDDLAERGAACTAGRGACARDGRLECDLATGQLACTAEAAAPGEEVCNGVDDDCNGRVDDVPGANARCTDGIGGCLGVGLRVCGPGGELVCTARASAPGEEVCNAVDDDCDGPVDEDLAGIGAPCAEGEGACRSTGVMVCDPAAGALVCGAAPGPGGEERCNAVDDDCDGVVDEVAGLGDGCMAGVGACAAEGAWVCAPAAAVDGGLICDAAVGRPAVERCNAVDDDCDGVVDEVRGAGDDCAVGVGACAREGALRCDVEAEALACDAEVVPPGQEICFNGLDDDCDGAADEGPCPERCDNGLDDDLDGATDCADDACAGGPGCPCGNGLLDAGEGCDDGGVAPGDGCDGACAVEPGFACDARAPGACDGGVWAGIRRTLGAPLDFVGVEEAPGAPFVDGCPAGRVMVGVDADVGSVGVVALAGVCAAPVRADGVTRLVPESATPLRGVPRDEGTERALCPDGAALVGLAWDAETDARGTAALVLRCGEVARDAEALTIGAAQDGPAFRFVFGARAVADCPPGAAVAGLIGEVLAPVDDDPGGVQRFAVRCDAIAPLCAGPSVCVADAPEPEPAPEPDCPTDGDGRPDCDDPACAEHPGCVP